MIILLFASFIPSAFCDANWAKDVQYWRKFVMWCDGEDSWQRFMAAWAKRDRERNNDGRRMCDARGKQNSSNTIICILQVIMSFAAQFSLFLFALSRSQLHYRHVSCFGSEAFGSFRPRSMCCYRLFVQSGRVYTVHSLDSQHYGRSDRNLIFAS